MLKKWLKRCCRRIATRSLVTVGELTPTAQAIIASACYQLENQNKDTPPADVIARYSNDLVGGYAEADIAKAIKAIDDQRFSLVREHLKARLENTSGLKVIEIGSAGGALLGTLARTYPQHRFVGTDFSVKLAQEQFGGPNVAFEKGYHLEIREAWRGDILVFVSTATCLLPREIDETFRQAKENRIKTIILDEPWWWGHRVDKNCQSASSIHMKGLCWGHNYPGYLDKYGYTTLRADLRSCAYKDEVDRLFLVAEIRQQ
jgi:hypothetical protein